MSLKKENAIKDILVDFEKFANLILQQLDILENIVNSGEIKIPDNIYQQIMKNEKKFDKFEVDISEKIINTIVLYNPMATDLRKIMACFRMSINLERIGDIILNIINFIIKIKDPELFANLQDVISNMLIFSTNMVKKSLISFINSDKEYAIWTIKNDEVVDELNRKLLKKAIKKSDINKEIQQMLFSYINIKEIVSNIERMADHATNIAEASIYSLEGTDMRHKKI
ncbi:MAG: phosphate uptake regulator PhoU [Bacteroidales bacterium]|nr:phosphate uptake regulator PhoU [Bacteroidales bacterium]